MILSELRFLWLLGAIVLVGVGLRVGALVQAMRATPLAQTPILDAASYWEWAGRIAQGQLVGATPFQSAPLYPYFVGAIRAIGGGLIAVYAVQVVMHAATALLVGRLGRARFGPATGLVAAGIFLLMLEPAYDAQRVLNSTLQLLLVALLWWALLRAAERQSVAAYVAAGSVLGLNCLANPPMLLAVPVLAVWAAARSGRTGEAATGARSGVNAGQREAAADRAEPTVRLRLACAAGLVGAAACVTGVATLHNWLACREYIPITAHAGITLAQGNAPGAIGVYTPVAGVSQGKDEALVDAARVYERRTGRQARWAEVDRFFRRQAIDYWCANPAATVELFGRKLYSLLTTRNYGEIYQPTAEAALGLWPGWLAPLPTPLVLAPALVGAVVLLRRPVRFAPELLLFVLPAAVVALFFYSPRYRLPMAPASAVLAAWGLVNAVQVRRRAGWSVAVGAALGGAIGLAAWNRASGFDPIEPRLASLHNQLGRLLWDEGKPAAALEHLSASLRIDPNRVMVRTFLAGCQRALGRYDEALAEYERARQLAAFDVDAVIGMAGTLVEMRRYGRAEELLREAAAAVPDSLPFQLELARVLLKQQKWAEALAAYSRIAQIAPEHVESQRAIGIAADQLGRFEIAKAAFERALALQPGDPGILRNLGVLHARNKRFAEAAEYFRQALKSAPGDADLQNDLTRVEAMPGGTGPTP